jgi:hypothetical protein
MQISAMSSALAGMSRASGLMDTAAAQIAEDSMPVSADAVPVPSAAEDGLITAVPTLLMAGELFKANAFVARLAQESYQAALDWVRPTT